MSVPRGTMGGEQSPPILYRGDFMIIKLYSVSDNPHTIPKHLENEREFSGTLRNATDVANPIFQLEMELTALYNYAYIPEFDRYYYLSPPVSVRNGLIEYSARVDVLQSWYNDFKYAPMIASRSDSTYNKFLPDGNRKFEQRTQNQYIHIGAFDPLYSAVMVTVG